MNDEIETTSGSPSRRQLIKGAAAGAAVLWTAPVVSGLTTPAYGASLAGCGQGWRCSDVFLPTICGASPSGVLCACYRETDGAGGDTGQTFCGQDFFCGSMPACGPGGSCPDGYACQSGCCGNDICAPLCGTQVAGGAGAEGAGRNLPN